ncbi:MAG: DUF1735 domain-containing protein [Porphyromonas sp.]|nr:DUF1735 domain-containing protein [Porphyromonas sp.]
MTTKYLMRLGTAAIAAGMLLLSGCQQQYTPLDGIAYIAQTEMQGNTGQSVIVGLEDVSTTLNVRLSNPISEEVTLECIVDDTVLAEYNEAHTTSLEALPQGQFVLDTKEVKIAQGSVVSAPINITIKAPTQEMKDSGKKYAIGLRIAKKSGAVTLLDGADKIVVLVAQQAIQDVVQFGSRSNIVLNLAEEHALKTWTVEFMVNMDILGKRMGQYNNQALFGFWGSGIEENGVRHSGEIYTRFGDAPIEGNRFQVKTKGTQMNSNMLFNENTWYHIALVCNNTKLSLYVNGDLDNEMDLPDEVVWIAKEGYLGNEDYLRANPMMAQVRLWNVARTQNQIKENMATIDPSSQGLIAYWRFNEGKGNTFKDATGKNPDAGVKAGGNVVWIPDVKLN